jgi:hypothetical protein
VETAPKRAFASALDWPGWSRGGRDVASALDALLVAAPRYAEVALAAGQPIDLDGLTLEVVERAAGNPTTAFGAPGTVAVADREPLDPVEAARRATLVEAAWTALDRIAASAPEALRKGPRGGGRDRSAIVAHVCDAEAAYAAVMGRRHRPSDANAIAEMRADLAAVMRAPSDGSPLAGKRWPPRYAARRIAWHALDHAWEIEDRSRPA